MLPNTDSNGIRYGYISANSLDPDLVCELQNCGLDVHWEGFLTDMRDSLRGVIEDHIRSDRAKELVEAWMDDVAEHAADSWYDDEPIHEGTYEGVKYRTSWLGGALHVWIFKSPHLDYFQECSPCVPRAGNLNCQDFNGVLAYDVPKEWRA
jgi:hypothetical protein